MYIEIDGYDFSNSRVLGVRKRPHVVRFDDGGRTPIEDGQEIAVIMELENGEQVALDLEHVTELEELPCAFFPVLNIDEECVLSDYIWTFENAEPEVSNGRLVVTFTGSVGVRNI